MGTAAVYAPARADAPISRARCVRLHLSPKDTMNILKSAITLVPVVALTGVVVVGIAVSVSLASWELL